MLISKIRCDRCGHTDEMAQVHQESTAAMQGMFPFEGTWGYMVDGDIQRHFCPECKAEYLKRTEEVNDEYGEIRTKHNVRLKEIADTFNKEHYQPYADECQRVMKEMLNDHTAKVVSIH